MSPAGAASHGGNPWALLEPASPDPSTVLDFSADLNPLGPPPLLQPLLGEAMSRLAWYPEPTYREFRESAARAEGVEPDQILPGNGTADLIHLLSRWRAGRCVTVMTPTFTEYERAAAADGSRVIPWQAAEEDGFAHRLPESWGPETEGGLLFLCNPNNPTGVLWPEERLLELVAGAERRGVAVVVDEAAMDLVEEGRRYSVAPRAARGGGLVVLRSLTKAFCIPGLRAGYLVGPADWIRQLQGIQPPWSMNAVAAFVGARLLGEQAWVDSARRKVGAWKRSLEEELRGLRGIRPYPSAANFLLCQLSGPGEPNRRLAGRLAAQGILIRVCDDFTGMAPGRFVRLAVRRPAESRRLLEAMREIEHAG
ncbi:MAG: threonine-phosphate decarboxylase [Candidatus Omnitrophica bacterium]|nr:threonine-phosphate decarboxylase [Candidatus Omnitrophota bacterium]